MPILQAICDIIILIGAVVVAIANISKFLGKPISFFQKKQDKEFKEKFKKELDEELPKSIIENNISELLLKNINPVLQEIKTLNIQQNNRIEILANSSKDVLREKIMSIYNAGKKTKTLTQHQREALDQYYKDYKADDILERHRHRYEFNNEFKSQFEEKGMVFSGINPQTNLCEIIELKDHPFFVACQFHPEFKSRPLDPHPLFVGLLEASIKHE